MREQTVSKKKLSNGAKIALLGAALAAGIIVSLSLGRYPISVKELLGILASRVFDVEQFWTDRMATVFLNVRLPRVLVACMVGCCLSVAGASYQGIFRNPMAAPDVLGASTGAAFGAALALILRLGKLQVALLAFAFSILCVVLVMFCSSKAKGSAVLSLVLCGIMISSLFQAGTSFLKTVADPTDQLPAITYWLMGSLSGVTMRDLGLMLIPMAIGLAPIFLLRWRINILTMDEDEARTLGINTKMTRAAVIISATLITAASVSISGMIGWVGLVIPHLCRRLVGSDFRSLIPASALGGALFLLLVDDISRNALITEIPIGVLTAFVGAPFFIWLLSSREG